MSWLPFIHTCSSPVLSIRSEEHTSELQSQSNLVCRLLLEKQTVDLVEDDTERHAARHGRHGAHPFRESMQGVRTLDVAHDQGPLADVEERVPEVLSSLVLP